jgi:hypothetical protein
METLTATNIASKHIFCVCPPEQNVHLGTWDRAPLPPRPPYDTMNISSKHSPSVQIRISTIPVTRMLSSSFSINIMLTSLMIGYTSKIRGPIRVVTSLLLPPRRHSSTLTWHCIHGRKHPIDLSRQIRHLSSQSHQSREGTSTDDFITLASEEDKSREIRKQALHLRLHQLGIDADELADAALRSVSTTGQICLVSWSRFCI